MDVGQETGGEPRVGPSRWGGLTEAAVERRAAEIREGADRQRGPAGRRGLGASAALEHARAGGVAFVVTATRTAAYWAWREAAELEGAVRLGQQEKSVEFEGGGRLVFVGPDVASEQLRDLSPDTVFVGALGQLRGDVRMLLRERFGA